MTQSTIGKIEKISIDDYSDVPAKIDTGADSSSIWASNITITDKNELQFMLFGPSSSFYDGKIIKRKDYSVVRVMSSNGQAQLRYRTHFLVNLAGRNIKVLMNLTDRSQNEFPVLIGRRTIAGKFLVDVTKSPDDIKRNPKKSSWNKEHAKNPQEFHQKYFNIETESK